MSNTLLTPSIIARRAVMLLSNSLVTAGLVSKDHTTEFTGAKVGDTITIRVPPTYTAEEFSGSTSTQNITETSTTLQLEKHFDVTVAPTSKEMTLSLSSFSDLVIAPAMLALATAINSYVLSKYVEVPYFYDTGSGFPDSLAELALVGKVLDSNLVPTSPRYAVVSPAAKAKILGIDNAVLSYARGDNGQALRTGQMGQLMGLDWYMDQQVKSHTCGTAQADSCLVNGAVSAGATSMAVDGSSGTHTLKKGDLFTVAGVTGQFVVTADATASSGAFSSVSFYPAAPTGGFADNAALTIKASHVANLAFHPNAFALACVPLELPMGGAQGEYINYNGVAVRVVYGYNHSSKTNLISFDCLCGAKTQHRELAARIIE